MQQDPDIYKLLFEQTPLLLRLILGVLSLGIFTLAGYIYHQNLQNLREIEDRLEARMNISEQTIAAQHLGLTVRLARIEGYLRANLDDRHADEIA